MGNNIKIGIITSLRSAYPSNIIEYTILSENSLYYLSSDKKLDLYEKIQFVCTDKGIISNFESQGIAQKWEYDKLIGELISRVDINSNMSNIHERYKNFKYYEILNGMLNKIGQSCENILRYILSGAPFVVRFHGDGDGSCAALSLYLSFQLIAERFNYELKNMRWILNKGIDYNLESLYHDESFFNSFKCIEKPVILITDFGTSIDSNIAIEKALNSYAIFWHDHHPINENFIGVKISDYINPLTYNGGADFTAGLLSTIFGECLSGIMLDDIREASLISDFSEYADKNNVYASKIALVLDFITGIKSYVGYLDGPITPKYISKIINDKEQFNSIYTYANNMLNDAIEIGVSKSKIYQIKDGIKVYVFNFDFVSEKYGGYLLPGRYSSKLHGYLESISNEPIITVVSFVNSISIRISKNISSKIGLLKVINSLKDDNAFIIAGGGHQEAGSIRYESDYRLQSLKALLKLFGIQISN